MVTLCRMWNSDSLLDYAGCGFTDSLLDYARSGKGLGCWPSFTAVYNKCSRRGPAAGVGLLPSGCGVNGSSSYMKKSNSSRLRAVGV